MEKDYPSEDGKLQFSAQQLSTDFPQYFHYERVKELVSCSCVAVLSQCGRLLLHGSMKQTICLHHYAICIIHTKYCRYG